MPSVGGQSREEERPLAHTAVPGLFVQVSVRMSVLSGPLLCRGDLATLQPGVLGAEAGPDLGRFLPVSMFHLGQGSDRDEPKHTQFRIIGSGPRGRP